MAAASGKEFGHGVGGNPSRMIGTLRTVVVDAQRPSELGAFYQALIGGDLDASQDDWVILVSPHGIRLAFQTSPDHEPPTFPDRKGSQQFHLDVHVGDIEVAEAEALALGATPIPDAGQETGDDKFRVYRDPAGHTFCLVWGGSPT